MLKTSIVGIVFLAGISLANTNVVVSTTFSNSPKNLKQLLSLSPSELVKCDIALMNLLCAERLRGSEDLDVQQKTAPPFPADFFHYGVDTKHGTYQ